MAAAFLLLVLLAFLAGVALAQRRAASMAAAAAPAVDASAPAGLALFAQHTHSALVMTDAAGVITWANAGFERLTGYSLAEARGHKPGALLQCAHTDPLTVLRMRAGLAAREHFACEVLNRRRDGSEYWVALELQPRFDPDGALGGFMALSHDVTERRLSEQALRASQALLASTGRIAGVGGWAWDLRLRRLEWTAQTALILGRDPDEPPTLRQCLAHCARPQRRALVAALRGLGEAGALCDLQLPFVTRDGRALWVRLAAEAEYDDRGAARVVGALQDVTARVAMKAEIQRNAQLLRAAIDALDEAFVLYDPEDRLVYCNERYRQLYATVAERIVPGTRFEELLRAGLARGQYPAAVGQEDAWLQRRLQAHRDGGDTVQRLDNGRIVRIAERTLPDGHRVGFRVDITELVEATEKAERADRAKSEFIATLSHELRTPLQSINGFSDLGRHFAAGQPQFVSMFEDIHAGGQRMLELVNALLDVSKFDSGLGHLQLRSADLMALADGVAHELEPLALQRQVALRLQPPAAPLRAEVDVFRLQQVLRNVLANALRFAPAGTAIEISGHDDGPAGLRIEVRDHGPGIPPDEAETIFEPFVQSSRTRSGAGGTGLGLTICRRILAAHQGHIEAVQPQGTGALIRIRLPAPTAASAAPETTAARSLRRLREPAPTTPPPPTPEQAPWPSASSPSKTSPTSAASSA